MTRYVIVGAGALGALLAAQLRGASIDTVLVARGRNLDVIRESGLTIHRPDATDVVEIDVVGTPGEVHLTPDDIIVLATKTQDAEQALQDWSWQPVSGSGVAADLPIVTLHNGLSAEDAALRRFSRVVGVSMWIAASHIEPGVVVSPGWPLIGIAWVGALGLATTELADRIAADFETAGYRARPVDDIRAVKAHKLLGNLSNALDLFDGSPEELDRVRQLIIGEANAAYSAADIVPVDPSSGLEAGSVSLDIRPVPGQVNGKRSTWQSFARGRGSEIDFLNGEIVYLGRRHGTSTPVNERVQRVLGALATAGGGVQSQPISLVLTTNTSKEPA